MGMCSAMVVKKALTPFPSSCSFDHSLYKATRDGAELPRLLFNLAKFINWKVVEQTTNQEDLTSFKAPLNALLLGFPNIKTQF